jgi:energy-converting hydrogenase Eha subunit C
MAAVPLFEAFEAEVVVAADALDVQASAVLLDPFSAVRADSL